MLGQSGDLHGPLPERLLWLGWPMYHERETQPDEHMSTPLSHL